MNSISNEKVVPVNQSQKNFIMQPLSKEKIEEYLSAMEGWVFGNDKIEKEFVFNDFRVALSFLVRVAFEAEELNHHPEIFNVYNKVRISLQTHDVGNKVSEADVELARKIDLLLKD